MPADTSVASVWHIYEIDKSATRVDIALLVSALFLQRFALPVGGTFLGLDLMAHRPYFIVPIPFWEVADPIRSALVVSGLRVRDHRLPAVELQQHHAAGLLSIHCL